MTDAAGPSSLTDIPFDAIVSQSVAGIYVLQDERFVYANDTWAALAGYTVDEMLGDHLSRFVPPDFLGEVLRLYHLRLKADPPSIHFITHGLHKLGHELRIEVHGTRIMYRGRPAVMGVGVDVTERLRDEEELRRSRQQLQELSTYMHRKLEEQRLSFSRDVHDVLGGMLTSIKMDTARILRRADTAELQELTRGLMALTQEAIETVKGISEALRPSQLEHLELPEVMAAELNEFTRRFGVPHTLDAEAPILRLSPRRATTVYRIFNEAMTNVARHAQAGQVAVALQIEGERFVMSLQDDGVGFDPAAQDRSALGLLSMTERAREIGAELTIRSAPGQGTRLVLSVPLL